MEPKKDKKKTKNDENPVTESVAVKDDAEEKPVVIPSRLFVKELKSELKGQDIPESVYVAFQSIVPPVDTEKNYRKIWKETFKRK